MRKCDSRRLCKRILTLVPIVFLFFSILLFGQNIKSNNQIFLHEPTVPSNGSQRQWIKVSAEIQDDTLISNLMDAPGVFKTIEGINFNEDAANTNYYHIPPDPIGAAGMDHVVSVVNTSIEWFAKSGFQQNSESLISFFTSLSPLSIFDPKVIYDQYEDRFIVVVLDQTEIAAGDPSNTSRILIAVSSTGDPNDSWHFDEINSIVSIGNTDYWADYPGIAVDEEALYITANIFSFGSGQSGGARLWIVNKNPFYSGGSALFTVHDPQGDLGVVEVTMQPAHTFGIVPSNPTNVGTWLVGYSGLTTGFNEYLEIIQVNDPLGSPNFSNEYLNVSNIDDLSNMPDAPQSGTSRLIETNDRRALQAVWRNDELWICAQVVPPSGSDAGQATAHWWQVNTMNLVGGLSLIDQGNVGGEDIASGTYTFFPAISVDKNGNMAIGFSASASSIYPGAYYTGRLSTDSPGTVQPSVVFAAGLGYYYRQFNGTRNRWGDYSGMSVDPVDDETFWVFNEYALTRGTILTQYPTQDGRWGTRFANFKFSSQSVSPGDIIITEIMQNPTTIIDSDGEWLEIYNTSTSDIDLNGWKLRDDDIDEHIIGGPLIIPSHEFLVLGNNDDTSVNGDYTVDYRYSDFLLANGVDEVVLEDPDGIEIDRVNYDGGPGFPDPNGASMTLTDFQADNNIGSNWFTSTTREPAFIGPTGDLGSPGTLGVDQALPVTLTSFTATAGNNKVTLHWITESELNNVGFRVLRAADINGPYQIISSFEYNPELEGQFNSNISHKYFYSDDLVTNGITFWYKLVDVDVIGVETEQGPISVTPQNGRGEITTIGFEVPTIFELHPAFPNPFNPETNIMFDIPFSENVLLTNVAIIIYNTLGQKVNNLFQGKLGAGVHMVSWNGESNSGQAMAGGTYFAVLKADRFQKAIKLILLK